MEGKCVCLGEASGEECLLTNREVAIRWAPHERLRASSREHSHSPASFPEDEHGRHARILSAVFSFFWTASSAFNLNINPFPIQDLTWDSLTPSQQLADACLSPRLTAHGIKPSQTYLSLVDQFEAHELGANLPMGKTSGRWQISIELSR